MSEEITIKEEPVMEVDLDLVEVVKNEWLPEEDLGTDMEDTEHSAPGDSDQALEHDLKQENIEDTCDVKEDPNLEISFVDSNIGHSRDEILTLSPDQYEFDPLFCTSGRVFGQNLGEHRSECSTNTNCVAQTESLHGDKLHEPEQCRERFTQSHRPNMHSKTHSPVQPYKCEICGKCFTQKGNFNFHLKIHSDIKDYKCHVCGKCFSRNYDLQIHLKIHSGEKNYKCEVCGKCFTRSCHLKVHLKVHLGIKDFQCKICMQYFMRDYDLQSHLKIHTGVKDFKCEVCGKCFSLNRYLQTHLKMHSVA